jgi:hypothetical protein
VQRIGRRPLDKDFFAWRGLSQQQPLSHLLQGFIWQISEKRELSQSLDRWGLLFRTQVGLYKLILIGLDGRMLGRQILEGLAAQGPDDDVGLSLSGSGVRAAHNDFHLAQGGSLS